MIKFDKVSYRVSNQTIINNISLHIALPGLYFLLGPSGSGKTTLIHLIAGLIKPTEGSINVLNMNINQTVNLQKHLNENLSIAYQHPVFFEDMSVIENINIVADHNKSLEKGYSTTKQILKQVGLEQMANKNIRYLSGGEKARVNIVRALTKKAPIYLFDEPTAALDEEKSKQVFNLLEKESAHKVVIVVTHDKRLAEKYSGTSFYLSYGKLVKVLEHKNKIENKLFSQPNLYHYEKNVKPIAQTLLKRRRKKNGLAIFSVTLGLISLGLGSLIVNSVNYKLNSALKGSFSEQTTLIQKIKGTSFDVITSAEHYQVSALAKTNGYEFGSSYINDFASFFPTTNRLALLHNNQTYTLPSFHVDLFNEPLFLFEVKEEITPYISKLENDEVCLELPLNDFRLLISVLGLPYTNNAAALGAYLTVNEVHLLLMVSNNNWDYSDEQLFRLRGVRLSPVARVIVGDPLFSEKLFEEKMLLPSSTNLTKEEEFPWVLKKRYFIVLPRKEDLLYQSESYSAYFFVSAKTSDFITALPLERLYSRVFVYKENPHLNDLFRLEAWKNEENYFYSFTNGFNFYEQNLLLGFSHNFLLTKNEVLLEEMMSEDIHNDKSASANLVSEEMLNLNLMYNGFSAFTYVRSKDNYALDEIIISKGAAKKLNIKGKGEQIFAGVLTNLVADNDTYQKTYEKVSLKVADIIEGEAIVISQHALWPYLFFKDVLNTNPFMYIPTSILFEGQLEKVDEDAFIQSNPYATYSENINGALGDLETYTNFIALSVLITAILIVVSMIYLLHEETKEQFNTLLLFGYNEKSLKDIRTAYMFYFIRGPTLVALLQTLFLSIALEVILSAYFNTSFAYRFNYKPYLMIIGFSALITIFLSFLPFKKEKIGDILTNSKKDL